jgi:Cu(I)/Ag(I) efflux system membrane fusion protein
MKNQILALALAGAMLSACNGKDETKPATAKPSPPTVEEQVLKPQFPATDSFKVGIGKVYSGYLRIENALAHDDFRNAEAAFEPMHMALHTLSKEGMDSVSIAQWDSLDGRLMKVLHPMSSSKDIAAMRDHLADFTPLMLEAIDEFGLIGPDKVFLFHCPMARNNEGADWMQKDKALENPFYGKAMPHCGSLVEEVKI